jgi:hypothetical protein
MSNLSFPHPVLGNDDDYLRGGIELAISCQVIDGVSQFRINLLEIDLRDLALLLEHNSAMVYLQLRCNQTISRFHISLPSCKAGDDHSFQLPQYSVYGSVQCQLIIEACNDIADYSSEDFSACFSGSSFRIAKGALLAVSETYEIDIPLTNSSLYDGLPSIMQIKRGGSEQGIPRIIWDNPKILVELSHEDYGSYSSSKHLSIPLIHSALCLPILVRAFHLSTQAEYEALPWAAKLRSLRSCHDVDDDLTLAYEVLDNPVGKGLEEFVTLCNPSPNV